MSEGSLCGGQVYPNAELEFKVIADDLPTVKEYPEDRMIFCAKVGELAEDVITRILKENGFDVRSHDVFQNGCDVVFNDPSDVAIEIWNWSRPYKYSDRIKAVVDNLKEYKHRFIVASFLAEDVKDYFLSFTYPIYIIELNFQILPEEYKSFYRDRKGKLFLNNRTIDTVREKLKPLVKILRRIKRDNVLEKYNDRRIEIGDQTIYDMSDISVFNQFVNDLKTKTTVDVYTVHESLIIKPISTKGTFYAHVCNRYSGVYNIASNNNSLNRDGDISGMKRHFEAFNRYKIASKTEDYKAKVKWKVKHRTGNYNFIDHFKQFGGEIL